MKNGAYKFSPDSGVDAQQNGTLASVECEEGYQLMKKTGNNQYKEAVFSDKDAFFCHYSVWVGRKATDLGYICSRKRSMS